MALPTNPPATTTPTALKTWAQAVVDTVTDHDERIDIVEGLNVTGGVGSALYLHANYI